MQDPSNCCCPPAKPGVYPRQIKAIVAECNSCNIDEINNYIFNQYPRYKVVVLVWEKPEAAYGVMGKYIGKYTIEEFKALPGNCFGDVLFYDSERTLL